MADSDVYRTILPAGTVITASGQSGAIMLSSDTDATTLDVVAVISAVSGTTPSITFTVQRSADAGAAVGTYPPGSWSGGTAGTAQTAAGRSVISAPAAPSTQRGTNPSFYRVTWAVSGTTPSFTLALYGE